MTSRSGRGVCRRSVAAQWLVGVLVVLAGWAGVVASPAGAADSWSCTAVAQPSGGFLVSWTTPPATAFRVVVERDPYALDWYWAGRVNTDAAGSFFDTGNAHGAIQMEYRIKALDTSRAVLSTVPCSLTLDTHGPECTYSGDGTRGPYGPLWDVYPGDGVDYVVLVKAATSDRYWWQGRGAATSFFVGRQSDQLTPKIRIAVRQNRQYVTSIDCIPVAQGRAIQISCGASTGLPATTAVPWQYLSSAKQAACGRHDPRVVPPDCPRRAVGTAVQRDTARPEH